MPSDSPFDGGFRIVGRIGEAIRSLEDWRMFGEPAGGAGQWAEGRSALEEGRAWVSLGPLLGLLQSHAATRGFAPALVRPEVPDAGRLRGRTRHTDVLACGHAAGGKTLVAVEAKADERFDERTLADAVERGALPARTSRSASDALCQGCSAATLDPSARAGQGTPLPARSRVRPERLWKPNGSGPKWRCSRFHEFRTPRTDDRKNAANARDWTALFRGARP